MTDSFSPWLCSHEWASASEADALSLGLTLNSCFRKSLRSGSSTSASRSSTKYYIVWASLPTLLRVSLSNKLRGSGKLREYIMTPTLHRSTLFEYRWPLFNSGAENICSPVRPNMGLSHVNWIAALKSIILSFVFPSSPSITRLAGLISRWQTPFECM